MSEPYTPDSTTSNGDDAYVSKNADPIPVDADSEYVEGGIDTQTADSDEQLARDDNEAIDQENILEERTRGAAKPKGTYREPGDEEGLPGAEDGTSRGA